MKKLSHLDSSGRARMVDTSGKPVTRRRAVASARVRLAPETVAMLRGDGVPKGDALAVARLAGIQGAKLTAQLIPLCHPLPLDHADVHSRLEDDGVRIWTQAVTTARTGVEMEALTAAAVAGLALIDMVKAVDRSAHIERVRLEVKEGGQSGRWTAPDADDPWPGPGADA